MTKMKLIENSKKYYIAESGHVYRLKKGGVILVNGWNENNLPIPYRRVWICYKDRTQKKWYNHILVAIYFKGGDQRKDGKLVLHGQKGYTDNCVLNVEWGTSLKNQTEDRKRDGTYMNRGKIKCPF